MRILVFGAGAVGSAIGGFLSAHHDVLLVGRGNHIDSIRRDGLGIRGILGESHHSPQACQSNNLAEHPFLESSPDWILITVKATDTAEAVRQLLKCLPDPPSSIWMHVQNGLGNYETIQEELRLTTPNPQSVRLLSAMTITGYEIAEPGFVDITVYGGPGKVGWLSAESRSTEAQAMTDMLAKTPLVFEYTEEMISFLWAKLLYNSCLNPLGALLRVPYGELRTEWTLSLMRDILKEAFALARFMDVPLFWSEPGEYYRHLVDKLIPATALHEPSMLADLNRGRRTEIQSMNGYIVRESEKVGLEAPVNQSLVRLIEASSEIHSTKNP